MMLRLNAVAVFLHTFGDCRGTVATRAHDDALVGGIATLDRLFQHAIELRRFRLRLRILRLVDDGM
jgi:hypothetical protein